MFWLEVKTDAIHAFRVIFLQTHYIISRLDTFFSSAPSPSPLLRRFLPKCPVWKRTERRRPRHAAPDFALPPCVHISPVRYVRDVRVTAAVVNTLSRWDFDKCTQNRSSARVDGITRRRSNGRFARQVKVPLVCSPSAVGFA